MTKAPLKILSIFGTRPEAIKMAPVLDICKRTSKVDLSVCVTAQHRQMLDQVLDIFEIKPKYDLDLMVKNQSPTQVIATALPKIEEVLKIEKPNWVLVQGDTSTTLAATLVAYYLKFKIAHIEAGLRTGNKWQPFPEEINRKSTSAIADLHFCPTKASKLNLIREGISKDSIFITGNTVIDSLHYIMRTDSPNNIKKIVNDNDRLIILVTVHRRENFGRPIENICIAIEKIALKYPNIKIVFPMHMNAIVQENLKQKLSGLENIKLLDPLDYVSMVHLMKNSYIILTDSGGIQEEAIALGRPVLVMREVTERPEGVHAGIAKLVGTNVSNIVRSVQYLLEEEKEYKRMGKFINLYGDGRASSRILRILLGEKTDEFIAPI